MQHPEITPRAACRTELGCAFGPYNANIALAAVATNTFLGPVQGAG